MTKRTPEQVHADGGHDERTVRSCSLCHPADADAETVVVGEPGPEPVELPDGGTVANEVLGEVDDREAGPDDGPLPEVDPASYAEDSVPLPAERLEYVNGRVRCYLDACPLPEFVDGIGLCGGHYATRPDLRKKARHG